MIRQAEDLSEQKEPGGVDGLFRELNRSLYSLCIHFDKCISALDGPGSDAARRRRLRHGARLADLIPR